MFVFLDLTGTRYFQRLMQATLSPGIVWEPYYQSRNPETDIHQRVLLVTIITNYLGTRTQKAGP